jgi:hypothetical protein
VRPNSSVKRTAFRGRLPQALAITSTAIVIMKTQQKLAFLCVATTVLLAPALAHSAGRGFQGLSWGASEQTVRHKYAGQVKSRKCEKPWSDVAKIAKITCNGPYIERYEVAGIPFQLVFYMSEHANKLTGVNLYYSTGHDSSANPDAKSWRDGYNRLYHALVMKSGQPRVPSQSLTKNVTTASTATWATQDTVIELTSLFSQSNSTEPAYGEYSINYSPSTNAPSNRL